jgi:hypothetical protein
MRADPLAVGGRRATDPLRGATSEVRLLAIAIGWTVWMTTASASSTTPVAVEPPTQAEPGPLPLVVAATVVLDSPGEGRRFTPHYDVTDGDRWQLQTRRGGTMTLTSAGEPPTTEATPTTVDTLDAEVVDQQVIVTLVDATLEGADIPTLARMQAAVLPLSTVQRVLPADPRGRAYATFQGTSDPSNELGAELLDDMAWALDAVAIPLPDQAVGVGARWSWTRDVSEQGVAIRESLRAELLDLRGDKAVIKLTIDGKADPTVVAGIAIGGLTITGSGTVWLDLRRPPATGAVLDLIATLQLPATDTTPEQIATATTHLELAARSRPKQRVDRARGGG